MSLVLSQRQKGELFKEELEAKLSQALRNDSRSLVTATLSGRTFVLQKYFGATVSGSLFNKTLS